ncbi:hypothetical protein BV22DRAFT_1033889 [Leucogyrophana mollusca]|uniref:Uncharacterized protein n=1 Tax=Leucogyrophana mollusca TaxID=85980 RepID=A0ACB8BJG5_9AGAM|nr:hypothetical protein BV22DRAFT_1033889 [Leucogyrophana mollusca]
MLTTWVDRTLLDEEPLLSFCVLRDFETVPARGRKDRTAAVDRFVEDARANSTFLAKAQNWVDLAFSREDDGSIPSGLSVDDDNLLRILFNYYYRLHQNKGNDNEAIIYLTCKRRDLLGASATEQTRSNRPVVETGPREGGVAKSRRGRGGAPTLATRQQKKRKQKQKHTGNSAILISANAEGSGGIDISHTVVDGATAHIDTEARPEGISHPQPFGTEESNSNSQQTSLQSPHNAAPTQPKPIKRKAETQKTPVSTPLESSGEESSLLPSVQDISFSFAESHRPKRIASNHDRLAEMMAKERAYKLNPNDGFEPIPVPAPPRDRQVATRGRKPAVRGTQVGVRGKKPRRSPVSVGHTAPQDIVSPLTVIEAPSSSGGPAPSHAQQSEDSPAPLSASLDPTEAEPSRKSSGRASCAPKRQDGTRKRHSKANREPNLPPRASKRARRSSDVGLSGPGTDEPADQTTYLPAPLGNSPAVERAPALSAIGDASESIATAGASQGPNDVPTTNGASTSGRLGTCGPVALRIPGMESAHISGKRSRSHYEATSGEVEVPRVESLPMAPRLIRSLPRKVSSQRMNPRERDAVISAPQASSHQLTAEGVDHYLKDIAAGALMQSQESMPPIADWTQGEEVEQPFDVIGPDDNATSKPTVEESIVTSERKPRLPGNPPLWAASRQEICESTEYFRSYQGGVYSSKDTVKGYLLSAFSASRDIFHHRGKLIISHGGGKAESTYDLANGDKRHLSADDQEATDISVRALLKTYKDRRPLVLLADDKYVLFPFDLVASGCTYIVLGAYWISHAWAERQPASNERGHVVRYKFAFQWCEEQGHPWWISLDQSVDLAKIPVAPAIEIPPTEDLNLETVPVDSSSRENGQVNGNSLSKHEAIIPEALHGQQSSSKAMQKCSKCSRNSATVYKHGWMCLRPRCSAFWCLQTGERPPIQLEYDEEFLRLLPGRFETLPTLCPPTVANPPDNVTTSYAFSKGWHCSGCGRLSSRFKWEGWECAGCGQHVPVNGRLRQPNEFWHQRPSSTFLHSHVGKKSGIISRLPEPFNYGKGFTNRLTFILPDRRGTIHLILGNPVANEIADSIFREYQTQASKGELKLRRYPLRNHKLRGSLLTNYFSQNTGEPYQYVGGTGNTVSFDEAPSCICQALGLIQDRARLALGRRIPFNEILSAAYMERQKMSFHSDSEKGLGPTVASLSLGSTAFMHFRAHGATKQTQHDLTLILRHGDVLIMEGEGVQKYYEHTVIPMNFRIAATARCISSM